MTNSNTVTDAAYHTVHDYPGGAPSISHRIGVSSPRVLSNKVSDKCPTHHLTLAEAVKLMAMSGDLRILDAMAVRFDQLLVPVCAFEGISDTALLETYTNMMKELGEFSAAFHDSLADGRITRAEIDRMRSEMREFEQAGEELLNRAEQLVDD